MATHTKMKTNTDSRPTGKMHKTSIELAENIRKKSIQLCNQQLADTFDLFGQTKQAHWNVKGPGFHFLHELYDELAAELLGYVDMIAERATALGGEATGTVRMAANATRLDEYAAGAVGSMESVRLLVDRYAALAETTRQAIDATQDDDIDTSDLFTEISRGLDKALWFLEAHIQLPE